MAGIARMVEEKWMSHYPMHCHKYCILRFMWLRCHDALLPSLVSVCNKETKVIYYAVEGQGFEGSLTWCLTTHLTHSAQPYHSKVKQKKVSALVSILCELRFCDGSMLNNLNDT